MGKSKTDKFRKELDIYRDKENITTSCNYSFKKSGREIKPQVSEWLLIIVFNFYRWGQGDPVPLVADVS